MTASLRQPASALLDQVHTEIDRLVALKFALESFTEQPAAMAGEGAAPAAQGEPEARGSGAPPFDSTLGVRDASEAEPEAGDSPPVVVPPAKHAKESFVCSRCPATFKSRGWRDRHEKKHPPIPDVTPRGGERVVRRPPAMEAVTGGPFNGSAGTGQ